MINKILCFVGNCSLEIYLIHEVVFPLAYQKIESIFINNLYWLMISIVVIIVSYIYHVVISKLCGVYFSK